MFSFDMIMRLQANDDSSRKPRKTINIFDRNELIMRREHVSLCCFHPAANNRMWCYRLKGQNYFSAIWNREYRIIKFIYISTSQELAATCRHCRLSGEINACDRMFFDNFLSFYLKCLSFWSFEGLVCQCEGFLEI